VFDHIDTTEIVTYSLTMLNSDLHSAQVGGRDKRGGMGERVTRACFQHVDRLQMRAPSSRNIKKPTPMCPLLPFPD
jgi:hypothetical protein